MKEKVKYGPNPYDTEFDPAANKRKTITTEQVRNYVSISNEYSNLKQNVSFNFNGVDFRDAMDSLAAIGDINIIVGEEVSVVLPPLGHVLREGQYNMNLEVIVEDKFFKPLALVGNFEKSISIVAETVAKKKEVLKPQVSLSNVSVKRRKKPSFDKPAQKIKRKTNQVLESKTKITDKDIMSLIEALKSR